MWPPPEYNVFGWFGSTIKTNGGLFIGTALGQRLSRDVIIDNAFATSHIFLSRPCLHTATSALAQLVQDHTRSSRGIGMVR